MKNPAVSVIQDALTDFTAELCEVFLVFEEETEGHTRVELAHVYRSSLSFAMV